MIRKLLCALGCHRYSSINAAFTYIESDTYRMDNHCVYCGKEICSIVHIPMPNWIAAEQEKHVYDELEQLKEAFRNAGSDPKASGDRRDQ